MLLLFNKVAGFVERCSVKKVFLEISRNSRENTCARVSFLIKLQASGGCFCRFPTYLKNKNSRIPLIKGVHNKFQNDITAAKISEYFYNYLVRHGPPENLKKIFRCFAVVISFWTMFYKLLLMVFLNLCLFKICPDNALSLGLMREFHFKETVF